MAVKIDKLWSDTRFNELDNTTKLFYLYLISNPNIKSVGVVTLNLDIVQVHMGVGLEQIRNMTKELRNSELVHVLKAEGTVYFIVPDHFRSLPKSEVVLRKVMREFKELPNKLVEYLKVIGIDTSAKETVFIKPSEEEVFEYGMSQGYIVDAQAFVNFYDEKAKVFGKPQVWVDSNGKQVRDWKAKLRKVWFRGAKKVKGCKNAPEGYEYFYVKVGEEYYTPDRWINGLPCSNNFLVDKELKKKFNTLQR